MQMTAMTAMAAMAAMAAMILVDSNILIDPQVAAA